MTTIKTNFIKNIIDKDLNNNKISTVITRFPPEPNGYLHIGHVKSICLNFGIAKDYKGLCKLYFDDTNPANESEEFISAIKDNLNWLGFHWDGKASCASENFHFLYEKACELISNDKAYVCDLSADQTREYRGTLKVSGKDSPYRNRSASENLKLFTDMKNGKVAEGIRVLRAKIDMSSGNINMRDPVLYRIKFVNHHQTADKWCIYPMYDFTHPISDSLNKVTHSLCTLEFQDHRPLYNWVVENCNLEIKPHQYEFSRLNLTYTITSKRKLKSLVENNFVNGWDDPRMPTISGLRRRGYTPLSLKYFCDTVVGISKQDSITDVKLLEESIRSDLNINALRKNVVLNPLLVKINNLNNQILNVPNHPQNPDFNRRDITISNEIYIEQDDFIEILENKMKKLSLNGRARLMNGYVLECLEIKKDTKGNIEYLVCDYLEETLGGKKPADGKKPAGIIHWVDAKNCETVEIRKYDKLFNIENPADFDDISQVINKNSLIVNKFAKAEKSILDTKKEQHYQFNRVGYFVADMYDFTAEKPVFNLVVSLRDSFK